MVRGVGVVQKRFDRRKRGAAIPSAPIHYQKGAERMLPLADALKNDTKREWFAVYSTHYQWLFGKATMQKTEKRRKLSLLKTCTHSIYIIRIFYFYQNNGAEIRWIRIYPRLRFC